MLLALAAEPALTQTPGAFVATLADGSAVNFNQFPSKEAVYLAGGQASQTAAALEEGDYVFQVTDPSGQRLLSNDIAECRQFSVISGVIASTAPSSCPHVTGSDVNGGLTIQLFPFDNTPNRGGIYTVWVTRRADFLAGCAALAVANGLAVVDCGPVTGGNAHGFLRSDSKTDNFEVLVP